ncbi:MAG: hypothetical protein Q9174_003562 [Haloplaca sp. 1 TL-2023]
MRLIHTERLEFQEFFDSQTPKYAILSHRWTDNEVSFQDFDRCKEARNSSFDKISNFCSLAKEDGYNWAWIDTCCIDKKSSAELSEAINSMYAWYEKAGVCYVYLADVSSSGDSQETLCKFRGSVWFTRGWTLQELLAPNTVLFYNLHWKYIGSKISLRDEISEVTGINWRDAPPTSQCVARKLSWVSGRKTSRVEDMAYCMLGLCGVNMPLLYGEGKRAFQRLQFEIIKDTDDESIFAWFCDDDGRSGSYISGMIAQYPINFSKSAHIAPRQRSILDAEYTAPPYSMTNKGVAYPVSRLKRLAVGYAQNVSYDQDINSVAIELSCTDVQTRPVQPVFIRLIRIAGRWYRIQFKDKGLTAASLSTKPLQKRDGSASIFIPMSRIFPDEDDEVDWPSLHTWKYRDPEFI